MTIDLIPPRPIDSLECEANCDPDWSGITRRSALLKSIDSGARGSDMPRGYRGEVIRAAYRGSFWRGWLAGVLCGAVLAGVVIGAASVADGGAIVQQAAR